MATVSLSPKLKQKIIDYICQPLQARQILLSEALSPTWPMRAFETCLEDLRALIPTEPAHLWSWITAHQDYEFFVRIENQSYEKAFRCKFLNYERVAMPYSWGRYGPADELYPLLTRPSLIEEWMEWANAYYPAKKQNEDMREQLTAVLKPFKTLNAAVKSWPQLKGMLPLDTFEELNIKIVRPKKEPPTPEDQPMPDLDTLNVEVMKIKLIA